MTKDYQVIVAETVQKLTAKVQADLKDGWEPIGGVAVATHVDTKTAGPVITYFQSMVKKYRGMLH